jgi:hypothetical protein
VGRKNDIEKLARFRLSACSSDNCVWVGCEKHEAIAFTEVDEYEWKDIPVTFARQEPHRRSGRDCIKEQSRGLMMNAI